MKQNFSSIKILNKIKIRQRLTNLKSAIKSRPLRYAKPIILLIVLGSPLSSYAREIPGGAEFGDQATCANPKSKMSQARELLVSLVGLKKCLNPCATPLQKLIYCSRPCCLIAGLTSTCIAEKTPLGSKAHAAATACCIASWNAYGILLLVDREKPVIPTPQQ